MYPFHLVYADLDCILEKTDRDIETSSYMYQHHRVFSLVYYVRWSYDDSLCIYKFRRSNDCVTWFAEELKNLAYKIKIILSLTFPWEILREMIW